MDSQQDRERLEQDQLTSQQDAEQRAREWLVFLESEEASAEDRQRFEQWLALDTSHLAAYQQASLIWQQAAALEALKTLEPGPAAKQPADTLRLSRLQNWFSLSGPLPQWGFALAALVVVALVVTSQQPSGLETWRYQTAVAEKRTLALPDGSEISLSPKTRLEVIFSRQLRQIKLLEGEAFFDVARNPQRPFTVDSRHAQVKVLGTQFNVNSNSWGVTVAVENGKVAVASRGISGRSDRTEKLSAGQQVSVSDNKGLSKVQRIEPANAGAWRQDLRIYQASPLIQVLEDLGRYHHAELVIEDEALKQLPITAVFPTADVAQMLAALESVLPVRVVDAGGNRIEIHPRQ